jgi:MYXO-CTERM domain-containing protein
VCEGVQCDPGFVCEARASSDGTTLVGVCTSCDCRGCDDGQTCSVHQCVDNACKDKTCNAGSHCVAGDCVDNCADAACPKGEICEAGACIHDPNGSGGAGDGGSSAGGGDDGGIVIDPDHNGTGMGGARSDDGNVGGDKLAIEAKGCSCNLPASDSSGIAALALTALCGALAFQRRRKSR